MKKAAFGRPFLFSDGSGISLNGLASEALPFLKTASCQRFSKWDHGRARLVGPNAIDRSESTYLFSSLEIPGNAPLQ